MKIRIEIDEKALKELVIDYLARHLGDVPLVAANVKIETRSKQNYKSEWETASYRAVYEVM